MNFETLTADVNKILNKYYISGRGDKSIDKVVPHHNRNNLTVERRWFVCQSRAASAPYQVESSGRIGQLMWDHETAWRAATGR